MLILHTISWTPAYGMVPLLFKIGHFSSVKPPENGTLNKYIKMSLVGDYKPYHFDNQIWLPQIHSSLKGFTLLTRLLQLPLPISYRKKTKKLRACQQKIVPNWRCIKLFEKIKFLDIWHKKIALYPWSSPTGRNP